VLNGSVRPLSAPAVSQLRLVVDDFDAAVAFYRDALGLPQQAAFEGDGDARVVILSAGAATLELANGQQAEMIDTVEACCATTVRGSRRRRTTRQQGVRATSRLPHLRRVIARGDARLVCPSRARRLPEPSRADRPCVTGKGIRL
jgi:catechol 2,3-dioxygenase-like lactoylglutathione lyase family enzyme